MSFRSRNTSRLYIRLSKQPDANAVSSGRNTDDGYDCSIKGTYFPLSVRSLYISIISRIQQYLVIEYQYVNF